MWNDHVVTGHHDALSVHLVRLIVVDIVDGHVTGVPGLITMLYLDHGAV